MVIATPHDSHAELAVRTLEPSRHCVVDKVMALTTEEADRMIAARDRSGRMLSVFHNRRWDWDLRDRQARCSNAGWIGRPLLFESAVCRSAAPRGWRGSAAAAGTILYDWGAHLVDQALQLGLGPCRRLAAWMTPGPWEGVDSGGHGRIVLEFDDVLFQVETSRVCRIDRPRWWIVGSEGGFVKFGVDPARGSAPRRRHRPRNRTAPARGHPPPSRRGRSVVESRVPTIRAHWDAFYRNIAEHLEGRIPLAVTAEQAREVVRLLEAAARSSASTP